VFKLSDTNGCKLNALEIEGIKAKLEAVNHDGFLDKTPTFKSLFIAILERCLQLTAVHPTPAPAPAVIPDNRVKELEETIEQLTLEKQEQKETDELIKTGLLQQVQNAGLEIKQLTAENENLKNLVTSGENELMAQLNEANNRVIELEAENQKQAATASGYLKKLEGIKTVWPDLRSREQIMITEATKD